MKYSHFKTLKAHITIGLILFLILPFGAFGQIVIQWTGDRPGNTYLSDLKFVQISNVHGDGRVKVSSQLYKEGMEKVLSINGEIIVTSRGTTLITPMDWENVSHTFINNAFDREQIPPGRYTLCIEVQTSVGINKECFDFLVNPQAPPRLVYPNDKDKLREPFPVFTWLPPVPVDGSQVYYKLKVVLIHDSESKYQAMGSSPAIYYREQIEMLNHPYPPEATSFEPGMRYAWQVEAYGESGFSLGKSEIWSFTYGDEAVEKERPDIDLPFLGLKSTLDGSYYIAPGLLRFNFHGQYSTNKLNFTIKDPKGNDVTPPGVFLTDEYGDNRYELDLLATGLYEHNKFYLLIVTDRHGRDYYLRFKYKDIYKTDDL